MLSNTGREAAFSWQRKGLTEPRWRTFDPVREPSVVEELLAIRGEQIQQIVSLEFRVLVWKCAAIGTWLAMAGGVICWGR